MAVTLRRPFIPARQPIADTRTGLVDALWQTYLQGLDVFVLTIGAGNWTVSPVGNNRIAFGPSAPPDGEWQRGDIVWNVNAAVGQPNGWRCTVAGAPGTWVAMGNL